VAERQFNLVCFETLKFGEQSHSYENYRKIGGYDVWEKVLRGELTRVADLERAVDLAKKADGVDKVVSRLRLEVR